MKFGKLTVIGAAPHVGGRPALLCRCDCGAECSVQRKRVSSGHTQSCGFLQKQRSAENLATGQAPTHGMSGTKEWQAWMSMKIRTGYAHPRSGKYYFERGVSVAREWMNDFPAFLAHVGQAPSLEHSLDRIRSEGNYEPGNVKWSTDQQQNRNKTDNVLIEWKGEQRLMIEVVEELGLPYQTIHYRIQRAGWPVDRALTEPIKKTGRWHARITAANAAVQLVGEAT